MVTRNHSLVLGVVTDRCTPITARCDRAGKDGGRCRELHGCFVEAETYTMSWRCAGDRGPVEEKGKFPGEA